LNKSNAFIIYHVQEKSPRQDNAAKKSFTPLTPSAVYPSVRIRRESTYSHKLPLLYCQLVSVLFFFWDRLLPFHVVLSSSIPTYSKQTQQSC